MIKAIIFDLDGTLIQTEVLKAESYARAIHSLTANSVSEKHVLDSFGKFVGLSRPEVVKGLYKDLRKDLENNLYDPTPEAVQEKLIRKRLSIYHEMLNDYMLLSKHFCPFNLALLESAQQNGFRTVLATMSHFTEAQKVLDAMGVTDNLDLILTRDDVNQGKPHPEIYLKAANMLKVDSEECLVIEDSVNGIKAALTAKMPVFAVTNSITKRAVHSANLLEDKYIVDDPRELKTRVYDFIDEKRL